ncbi:MAG: rhomboid family intramembrane serine protease [Catenisphaera adipataccumulans]|jgi:rhomboid protease GluP|uniref:rhomboid family intramembrane serine protease n=1 Tax=Catenisphaera adipataccumulans TaxID=700500 RepID=UPI003D8F70C2
MNRTLQQLREAPVTAAVTILCLGVFTLIHTVNTGFNSTETAIIFGAYYKALISGGEIWRLLTCAFVHVDLWHIFGNLYSFLIMGPILEKLFGSKKYSLLLFGSVIGSSLFIYAFQGNLVTVGLSGGLYGLMAALFMILKRFGVLNDPRMRSAVVSTIVINVLINFMPGISYMGHLGGFLTGLLLGSCLIENGSRMKRVTALFCVYAAALCICAWSHREIPADEIYLITDLDVLQYEKDHLNAAWAEQVAKNLDRMYSETTGENLIYLEQNLQ